MTENKYKIAKEVIDEWFKDNPNRPAITLNDWLEEKTKPEDPIKNCAYEIIRLSLLNTDDIQIVLKKYFWPLAKGTKKAIETVEGIILLHEKMELTTTYLKEIKDRLENE